MPIIHTRGFENMKEGRIPRYLYLAVIWALCTFFAIGLLGWALYALLESFGATKDAAAWVQAVGSVLAIIVAIFVANMQYEIASRAAKANQLELLEKIRAVADHVAVTSLNAGRELRNGSRDSSIVNRFELSLRDCEYLIREVSFDKVPGVETAMGWLELRAAVVDVLHAVREIQMAGNASIPMRIIHGMELAVQRADRARARILAAVHT